MPEVGQFLHRGGGTIGLLGQKHAGAGDVALLKHLATGDLHGTSHLLADHAGVFECG